MSQYDVNLREYWRILKKRKFVVVFIAIVVGFFSTFFAVLRAPESIYTSTCSIKFEKHTSMEGLYARTLTWSGSDDMATQISIINSFSVFQKVAEALGLVSPKALEDSHLKSSVISTIENLQSKVQVSREKFTNIINIQVEDSDPIFAQRLANATATTYKGLHAEQQMKRTLDAIEYIEHQLRNLRGRLKESEEEFNRFTQENQLISIELQSENLLAERQELQNQIRKTLTSKKELEGIRARLGQFIKNPNGSSDNFFSTKAGGQYQAANNNIIELMLTKDTLLEDFTPQHPEVVAVSRKIIQKARKMQILLRLEVQALEQNRTDLKKELETIDLKTNLLMDKKIEFNRLKRKMELYNNMTGLLEEKNQEALIRKAEKPEEITIVKPALLPTVPVNPPKTVATGMLGVVIGLMLGLVAAFIVETFDTSLGAIEDVESTIGAQVLGIIPHTDTKLIQEILKEKYPGGFGDSSMIESPHLISHFAPKSMVAESFRALRTNIQFKGSEAKESVIAITSASPQEGKTFIATNLAITMAQTGMKTLLVGADMRRPMVAKALGIENTTGLSDLLIGNYDWRDTIKTITDIIMGKMTLEEVVVNPGLDNLHIITSGGIPPNPAELIESGRLKSFLQESEKEYDLILFDCPPILSTADAAILASKMAGVLIVYRVGSVSKGLLKRSTTQLEQVNCNIKGVILNGMKPEVSPDFDVFTKYYYYSYTEKDENRRKEKIGNLAFLKKKLGKGRGASKSAPTQPAGRRLKKAENKKLGMTRLLLLVVAMSLLATGAFWQNGLVESARFLGLEKLFPREDNTSPVKKVIEKTKNGKDPAEEAKPPSPQVSQKTTKKNGNQSGSRVSTRQTVLAKKAPFLKVKKPIQPASKGIPKAKTSVTVQKPRNVGGTGGLQLRTVKKDKQPPQQGAGEVNKGARKDSEPQKMKTGAVQKKPVKTSKVNTIPLSQGIPKTKTSVTGKKSLEVDGAGGLQLRTVRKGKQSPQKASRGVDKEPRKIPEPQITKSDAVQKKPVQMTRVKTTPSKSVDGEKPSLKKTTKPVSYPYSLYLGSFRTIKLAKKAISFYSKKGISPYWAKVAFKTKGTWFRVFAGHFKDPPGAKRYSKRHGLTGTEIKNTKFANLIGVYSSRNELEKKMKELSRLGYSPYTIGENGDKSRLFVGAYLTQKGALKHSKDLKSKGINCQVVRR